MNIGIITFINTINYGASLQAFALQHFIQNLGENAEIIQYVNDKIEKKEHNTGAFSLRKLLVKIVVRNGFERKAEAFKKFEKDHFNYGKVFSAEEFELINSYYDCFITGSDQVWNFKITHRDWNYFLDFVNDNGKKLSYAPSFGNVDFPEECYDDLKMHLGQFRALSVREQAGKKFIKNVCGLDAELVIDPTLILDKNEWQKYTTFVPAIKHYILVYFPHDKKKVFNFVKELKKKTGLPVVYLSISPKPCMGVRTIYDASPEEFLGWIRNADYVVTGSFHGTAFSLNFEKQFFYETIGNGSRIENLVTLTQTTDRNIENGVNINKNIDYSRVSKILEKERMRSAEWLRNSILGDNDEEN